VWLLARGTQLPFLARTRLGANSRDGRSKADIRPVNHELVAKHGLGHSKWVRDLCSSAVCLWFKATRGIRDELPPSFATQESLSDI
jgi:hypothetical protein